MKGGETKMNKKIMIPVSALLVAGFLTVGVMGVNAQEKADRHSSLIQKISQKFGLKEADVKAVFDQQHAERMAQMHAKMEEKLNQLVKEGKFTEAQKNLILAKHKEMQANRQSKMEAMKNMTPEQRKAEMEAQKKSLEDWAKQNNIDSKYLFGGLGMRGHMKAK
jgi:hypothetical protein